MGGLGVPAMSRLWASKFTTGKPQHQISTLWSHLWWKDVAGTVKQSKSKTFKSKTWYHWIILNITWWNLPATIVACPTNWNHPIPAMIYSAFGLQAGVLQLSAPSTSWPWKNMDSANYWVELQFAVTASQWFFTITIKWKHLQTCTKYNNRSPATCFLIQ